MEKTIENKVAKSGLITIDLEEWLGDVNFIEFDLAQNLWQGLVLKENDFREFLKTNNWEPYRNAVVRVHCSADAVIPTWAYMLLGTAIHPYTSEIFFGPIEEVELQYLRKKISEIETEGFEGSRVVVKGCSNRSISVQAYLDLVNKLQPVAKSLMYGEPCSTVPLFKKKAGN